MCDFPVIIKLDPPRIMEGEMYDAFPADCGKCLPCLGKRKMQWSFRLMEEKKDSFSAYFITLTYKDKFVKYGDKGMTGDKQDHKDFIKWLKYYEDPKRMYQRSMISFEELVRQNARIKEDKKLKYYGIIEYGDQGGRPHMHYIMYNLLDTHNVIRAWSTQTKLSKGVFVPGELKGKIDVDECNQNTIDYVLKYMVKVRRSKDELECKEKELQFISKGLGIGFVNDEVKQYIKREDGNQVVTTRGLKIPLPRYYNKKFLTDEERENKGSYIAEVVRKEKIREDTEIEKLGLDPSVVRSQRAEYRSLLLKNRKRRELK